MNVLFDGGLVVVALEHGQDVVGYAINAAPGAVDEGVAGAVGVVVIHQPRLQAPQAVSQSGAFSPQSHAAQVRGMILSQLGACSRLLPYPQALF